MGDAQGVFLSSAGHMPESKQFSLLIKPASGDCNLRCEYCFYLKKCGLYPGTKKHRMSDAVLERMISSYMGTGQQVYSFGWQGGEPTLMGVEFFRRVTDLQQKHGSAGTTVANGLQTNAVLIDDEMAGHFADFKFLLGCSLDGPAEIHDAYRRTAGGAPSHADVMKGIETLRRHGVEFNILVLVSRANAGRACEVYDYLVEQGFLYHQYIPCVEFDEGGRLLPFAISGEEWGDFLCELFDRWHPRDARRVSVRHFDSLLAKMAYGRLTVCTLGTDCRQYFVVEHNGDIYPCDFFVEPCWKIGNVADMEWPDALASPLYARFGAAKAGWNPGCRSCEVLDLCVGDCMKHRLGGAANPGALSALCKGWRRFLNHSRGALERLVGIILEEEKRRQSAWNRAVSPVAAAPGRNDPCPCGSGRKFKKCCGYLP